MSDEHELSTVTFVEWMTQTPAPEPPARRCDGCRWWEAFYDGSEWGDCQLVREVDDDDKPHAWLYENTPGDLSADLNTPAAWFCAGWEARKESKDND